LANNKTNNYSSFTCFPEVGNLPSIYKTVITPPSLLTYKKGNLQKSKSNFEGNGPNKDLDDANLDPNKSDLDSFVNV
jgi:hypothetical protein